MIFVKIQKNKALPIDQQLSSLLRERIARNRLISQAIVESIILCGRQGIALRGHRDERTHVDFDPLTNHGNFLALLQFRIQAGDEILKEHLQTAQGNALYTSKTIQNKMIAICGKLKKNYLNLFMMHISS